MRLLDPAKCIHHLLRRSQVWDFWSQSW